MSKKNTIFLIPYFGDKFPVYFSLFLHSVSYNQDYKFLCFTDIVYDKSIPENFSFIKFNKLDFKSLVEEKVGVELNLENPYKLCDLKPCYGLIFQDYIKEADFWGHSDIDLVLGNLDSFLLVNRILQNYDILSFRSEWLSGSFALYKNTDKVNSLFKNSKDWEFVFSNSNYLGFDECSKAKEKGFSIFKALMSGKDIREIPTEIESFTEVLLKSDLNIHFDTLIKESIAKNMLMCFNNGIVEIHKNGVSDLEPRKKYLHYHFITEKKGRYFKYSKWNKIPAKYYISRYGFHKNYFNYYLRNFVVKASIVKNKIGYAFNS